MLLDTESGALAGRVALLDAELMPVTKGVVLLEALPMAYDVEEAEGVTSLAPQIQGALTAAPTLLLR